MRLRWRQSHLAEELTDWGAGDDISPPPLGGVCGFLPLAARTTPRQQLLDVLRELQGTFLKDGQLEDYNAVEARMSDEEARQQGWIGAVKMVVLGWPGRWGTDLSRLMITASLLALIFCALFLLCDVRLEDGRPKDTPTGGLRLRLLEPFVENRGAVARRVFDSKVGVAASNYGAKLF